MYMINKRWDIIIMLITGCDKTVKIYIWCMKYLLIFLFYTLIGNLSIASDLIIDIFGKEKVKIYKIDENNFFRIYSSSGVFKTNNNIYGNTECDGTTEIYNKETLFNIICELREGENISHYIFKNNITTKGTENKFQ